MNNKSSSGKLAANTLFQAILNRSRESIKAGKGLSAKEFWADLSTRRKATKQLATSKSRRTQ